jgi:hypothetical protein
MPSLGRLDETVVRVLALRTGLMFVAGGRALARLSERLWPRHGAEQTPGLLVVF